MAAVWPPFDPPVRCRRGRLCPASDRPQSVRRAFCPTKHQHRRLAKAEPWNDDPFVRRRALDKRGGFPVPTPPCSAPLASLGPTTPALAKSGLLRQPERQSVTALLGTTHSGDGSSRASLRRADWLSGECSVGRFPCGARGLSRCRARGAGESFCRMTTIFFAAEWARMPRASLPAVAYRRSAW